MSNLNPSSIFFKHAAPPSPARVPFNAVTRLQASETRQDERQLYVSSSEQQAQGGFFAVKTPKLPSIGRQRCRNEPFYTCVPLSPDPFRQKRFHHLRILSHAKGLRPRVPELPGTRADGILDIARGLAGR